MLKQALSSSGSLNQIDLDVNRTFRNTVYFRDRYGPRQCALFRVLAAYSVYNSEVGYCQVSHIYLHSNGWLKSVFKTFQVLFEPHLYSLDFSYHILFTTLKVSFYDELISAEKSAYYT